MSETTDGAVGTDRRGLRVLDLATCLHRLATTPVGRVAYPDRGEIMVLPVNHVVDGASIAFRTTWGSKLHRATGDGSMSYEVDGFDDATRHGWSVLVLGRAHLVNSDAEIARLQALASPPWTVLDEVSWVRLTPSEITGRETVTTS